MEDHGALLRKNSMGHQGQPEVGKASGSLQREMGHKKNRKSNKTRKRSLNPSYLLKKKLVVGVSPMGSHQCLWPLSISPHLLSSILTQNSLGNRNHSERWAGRLSAQQLYFTPCSTHCPRAHPTTAAIFLRSTDSYMSLLSRDRGQACKLGYMPNRGLHSHLLMCAFISNLGNESKGDPTLAVAKMHPWLLIAANCVEETIFHHYFLHIWPMD